MHDCEIRLETSRKFYRDIHLEITKLKDDLEQIRRNPPTCFSSAIVYGARIRAAAEAIHEWQTLAQDEVAEMCRLEKILQSESADLSCKL